MALRRQINETDASFADPVLGINLRESEENLKGGESRLMQNCEYYGGVRIRRGSTTLNGSSLSGHRILGGHKYYYGGVNPTSKRLIAFNNRISALSDGGVETNLTAGMTAGLRTYFNTWPITDSCYISNGTDTLRKYDGTTFSTVTGTAIPTPRGKAINILDRMMAISAYGIERTDPRVDNIWSSNSAWATLRPQQPGMFTALHPYTMRGTDTLYPGALAFQERAHYLVTGTDFGDSVISATASSGENSKIELLDPTVGTASPDSVCHVPGLGVFWFTTDLNVYWMPEGQLTGRYVGDKIQSTGSTLGINSANTAQLAQAWMTYFDHMLVLSVPMGSDVYASTQFWMDMRSLRLYPERGPVWYGPMTGQTVGCSWIENQQGNNAMMGGEGNASTGAFVYTLRVPATFTDAVGTTNTAVGMVYQTPFKDFDTPSREKYVQAIHADCNSFSGTVTVDLLDLDGILASGLTLEAVT